MTGPSEDADRSLVLRIQEQDPEALGLLYDRHAARLMGLANRIVGQTGEAEEILQEVFLRVWRSAATFDPSRGTVLAWLLIATRSRAIDRVRARRPAFRAGLRSVENVPEAAAPGNLEAESAGRQWESLCRSAISELPPDQRRVLELAYFEGLTQEEIAEATATPLGTVKTRVRLGLMKLRARVRPYWRSERP